MNTNTPAVKYNYEFFLFTQLAFAYDCVNKELEYDFLFGDLITMYEQQFNRSLMTKHEATLALVRTYLDDLRTKLDDRKYVDGDFNEEDSIINDIEILINSLD